MANKKVTKKNASQAAKSKTAVVSKTKKASVKKPETKSALKATKATPREKVYLVQETTAANKATKKSLKVKKSYVFAILAILVAGALLFYFRSLFVAAVVNGQPISRLSVVQAAEKQSGKQSLDTLVRNTLIEQEAKKEHVTVSDKEVNDEITNVKNTLKKQGQNIDQVLAMQGMSTDDLKKLIRLDKLVGKIVGKDIKITDKQVNDYIATNKDALPPKETGSKLKDDVRNRLKQQALNDKVQAWLSDLQNKAKILYFVQY